MGRPPGPSCPVYVRDEEGDFTYQCRSDDMIVTRGDKIPGPELEHVLDEHPAADEIIE